MFLLDLNTHVPTHDPISITVHLRTCESSYINHLKKSICDIINIDFQVGVGEMSKRDQKVKRRNKHETLVVVYTYF